ncbi:MAG: hypothetical protein IH969_10115 [Candidatus Krumholzibacteriota bacterium]|nr:hypothetical protein [Candidatus Krumholzibacteriota bacterium]
MQSRRWITKLALLPLASVLAGCASTGALPNWLPKADETQTDVYGGWVLVQHDPSRIYEPTHGFEKRHWDRGELIAAHDDELLVLVDNELIIIPSDEIDRVQVGWYDSQWGGLAGLTFLGMLSTISNGLFLVFTAPAWLIIGSLSAASASHMPIEDAEPHRLDMISPYARFPMGMPSSVDPTTLRSKEIPPYVVRTGWPPRVQDPEN